MNYSAEYYAKLYFHNLGLFNDKSMAINVNQMLNICIKCPMLQVLTGKISFSFYIDFYHAKLYYYSIQ